MENPKWQLKITKKLILLKFLRNFKLLLWLSCSQIDINMVISIKYVWNTYCLQKGHAPRTFYSNCVRCQNPCEQQNFKILSTFQGQKNPQGQNFWKLIFLYITEKTRLYRSYSNKKRTFGHNIFIHKCYNGISDKIVFMSSKTGQKWHFDGFWEAVCHFNFDITVFIFLLWIFVSGQKW